MPPLIATFGLLRWANMSPIVAPLLRAPAASVGLVQTAQQAEDKASYSNSVNPVLKRGGRVLMGHQSAPPPLHGVSKLIGDHRRTIGNS